MSSYYGNYYGIHGRSLNSGIKDSVDYKESSIETKLIFVFALFSINKLIFFFINNSPLFNLILKNYITIYENLQ